MEYKYDLKIPRARIAVLIGKDGEIKAKIQKATSTKLGIDSKEGDIEVIGKDAIGLLAAREIIKAVGRGFNPEIALLLLKPEYVLNILSLNDFNKKTEISNRLKGRVIGSEGKTRAIIEDHTGTHISIYGKTIAIIGEPQNVTVARRAIESLLTGSPHAPVYKWLEKKRQQLHEMQIDEEEIRKQIKEENPLE